MRESLFCVLCFFDIHDTLIWGLCIILINDEGEVGTEMRNAKGKIAAALICLAPFAAMFGLTKLFFQDNYLLEWMLRHWYLGIWVIAAITGWMNAKWGYALSYSYALAVVFGQVTGEFIRNRNIAKVTAEMTNQEIVRLHHHPGFQLWMAAFALLMVLFGVFSLYQKSRKAQRKE